MKRWQPGDPLSRADLRPDPRPAPRGRRGGWGRLRSLRLLVGLAVAALLAVLTIPDQVVSRPAGQVGQASLSGQPASGARTTTAGQAATPATPAAPTVPAALTANLDPTLVAPGRLQTTGLNSTIRANWTAPADAKAAWQLISVWDGAQLMGEKVLSPTATAADLNGLQPNHAYTVAVQSMSAAGKLSTPLTGTGTTDGQSPMANAVFFENFDGATPGPLNPDYFDVRLRDGSTTPDGVDDRARVFVSEHHFHTELISGEGDAAVSIRPRGIFDFANRVGTFQFEVDMAPVQSIPGKWFEVHLSRHAPTDAQFFNLAVNENDTYPDDLAFSVARPLNATSPSDVQVATIGVNAGGAQKTVLGRTNNFTPKNVRVPVVLKVSQTSAEMFINGVSAVKATGFTLPFTQGEWTITHRAFYAPRSPSFPAYLQLIHWNTVQFDGPSGSFSPVRKTYLAPGCPGVKIALQFDCTVDANSPVSVSIPDAVAGMTSARLLFNPFDSGNCDHGAYTVNATVNGHSIAVPTQPATPDGQGEHCYDHNLASVSIPASWLKQGANVVRLGRQADQLEIEAAFNQPRTIGHAAVAPAPILAATNDNLLTGRPAGASTVDVTTYLFSQGADTPINYQIVNKTGSITPWLSIVTPTSGTITSIATGGSLVPITVRIDFTKATRDPGTQIPGILQVTGNVYIAIAYDRSSTTYDYAIKTYNPMITQFDKGAIPDYHGTGAPPPTVPPTAPPTAAPTPTPKPCQP
jgi:fibronectin type III domain protein